MKITWYGDTCFQITSSSTDKENIFLAIDVPENDKKSTKIEADILLKTSNITAKDETGKSKSGDKFNISSCGEYEIKGVFVQGIPSLQIDKKKKNIIYLVEAENIRICHLGLLGVEEINEEQTEGIGNVDILLVPIDGDKTIGFKEAVKVISLIEPKMVIPMCYNKEKLSAFLKVMGENDVVPQDKLNIQKKHLGPKGSDDKVDIVVLEEK
ncbi:MAG: MBL fold metallo-hydrolase [Candidatus Paceibacterota bacterium]|jgi:L-ascorbate metabolism protein UlaG (beta-lactamase superfamily)|nr:MBL fold metallo-hydrolase [bacterium]